MTDPTQITVVIPTYNRATKTLRFLERFQEQVGFAAARPDNCNVAIQVVIVDASSPDGTAEQVRQAYPHYPQVTVLSVAADHFWTAATNVGVRHALAQGAEFIFTVNDDAILPANHLAELVGIAQRHQLKILGNRINYLSDPQRVWSLGTYTHWGTADFLRLAYCDQPLTNVPETILQAEIVAVDALAGNGVLLHRAVFEKIGLYEEHFLPQYHADSELVMRAKQAGLDAYIAPGLCLYNDFHKSQKQTDAKGLARYWHTFLSKKSHQFAPAILYILAKYCPVEHRLGTALALGRRLLGLNYR
jgi:GT2 family glycosyltransferase